MMPIIITVITGVLQILDQVLGSNWIDWKGDIAISLAVITPLLVWLFPNVPWQKKAE